MRLCQRSILSSTCPRAGGAYVQTLLEEHFRLVTLWSKRVKGVGEAVIKDSQLRDAFGWCDA